MDMKRQGIFEEFVTRLRGNFDIAGWEKTREIWKELKEFKAKDNEDTKIFVTRFQDFEIRLKNLGNDIPGQLMANILLKKVNISALSEQSVVSTIEWEDKETVLQNVKRKLEQIVPRVSPNEEATTYWNEERSYRRDYQPRRYKEFGERRNSSSSGKWDDRRQPLADYEDSRRDSRSKSRGRRGERSKSRGRSQNRDRGRSQRQSQGRSRDKYGGRSDSRRREERNTYTCEKTVEERAREVYFTKSDNLAIIDSGCPKTIGGQKWLSSFERF